ncbi:NAD(P)-binding protein [Setomelanomma holmii]|uniref:NAD(P)-binding protein n=1 Tax=Setomelanomma holmii TaxID=210430 RepID=A0A9P4LJ67_9PLEO|nr:NAD(P)-binding protein [Setomelanomma holmii]
MAAPKHLATKDLFRLDGRTIIISGGAGAVGTCVGRAILESGADVVFVDIAQHDHDTWNESSITSAFTSISTTLRFPIRGLVSCAAISGESDACDYPIDVFRRIIDINITGTFLLARAAASLMHAANVPGSIVLIASISGHVSNRGINTSAYNASKAAVHQLARSLAAEWGHPQNTFPGSTATATNPNPSMEPREAYPGIRVNTVSPGHIDTPLSEAARKRGLTGEWARQNMLGRISEVEEYRAPVLFLLGDGSSYVTGAVRFAD